jgi:GT2 family glycosyltransferase
VKTLIAIPTSRDIEIQCAASIIGMEREGRIGVFCPQSYSIDASRNLIVEHALEIGYDYIMWVDSDMILPKNTLTTLMSHDKDIVSGVYRHKLLFGKNVVAKRFIPDKKDTYEDLTIEEVKEPKLIEIDGVGFGCVLTKVDIFRNIKKPWFRYSPAMGEDIYFCRKAQKAGYKIWLDTSIKADHIGTVRFDIKE